MVDKYDLTIYPCNLWVCTDFEEAKKRFRYKNSKEGLEGPLSDDCLALTLALTCCSVEEKKDKRLWVCYRNAFRFVNFRRF